MAMHALFAYNCWMPIHQTLELYYLRVGKHVTEVRVGVEGLPHTSAVGGVLPIRSMSQECWSDVTSALGKAAPTVHRIPPRHHFTMIKSKQLINNEQNGVSGKTLLLLLLLHFFGLGVDLLITTKPHLRQRNMQPVLKLLVLVQTQHTLEQ